MVLGHASWNMLTDIVTDDWERVYAVCAVIATNVNIGYFLLVFSVNWEANWEFFITLISILEYTGGMDQGFIIWYWILIQQYIQDTNPTYMESLSIHPLRLVWFS